jgi:hypothetical protein
MFEVAMMAVMGAMDRVRSPSGPPALVALGLASLKAWAVLLNRFAVRSNRLVYKDQGLA